ncbi:anthranilate synthase component I family protein [Campylobacter gastrosuis]|uniref:Anthranilate synthase component 1 n=1 Tax=Campylobacter gastrosuis TaxID=2974576 RepID=A0ABT7HRX5_9BACT|nr:anthranilate synthase component I family protein [Campylobacter gastrosuis]MDL0089388.1 anthranilate synthase component I family protein [Campylobacter gastrosuis]
MLLEKPIFYYKLVLQKYSNSYLAEDNSQVIIGIDCDYIDANSSDLDDLKRYFKTNKNDLAPFSGLFGVFAYEGVSYFEKIDEIKNEQYKFPKFIYANAKAYLHFDKMSKIYTFYGDEKSYYDFLKDENFKDEKDRNFSFKILSNLDEQKEHFKQIVAVAKEYIARGDIFQVVLSEQLKISTNLDSLSFYTELSRLNPSPYMFHFVTPYGDVVGSSPELVFEMKNSQIFVAPIAGTRPRGADANADEALKNELLNDIKELAEHKMLIDLARNDIGKVSRPKSVVVKDAMHVQFYESVMHIVSNVYGIKRDELDGFDVLSSIFPAGTLSGTPKIRAMQIISELETFKRNIYGGGLGFLHFNGDVQMAILIRSAIFVTNGNTNDVFVQSGAGIVYDSNEESEYSEICHKRASVIRAIENLCLGAKA